jgi:carboxypeptidase Taq
LKGIYVLDGYEKLLSKSKDVTLWESVKSIMEWDFETKMPPGGMNQRSMQMALIEQIIHQRWIDPEIKALLAGVKQSPEYEDLGVEEKRNIYLMQRGYDRETKLPDDLVNAIAKQAVVCNSAWKKAKAMKDFSVFKKDLEKMIELVKKKAHYLAADMDPYDALIDFYEPGATAKVIARVFESLKNGLIPLIKKCVASKSKPGLSFLNRPVPLDVQGRISQKLMEFAKYDLKRGRLDETEHPFTTGFYDDVRICTHYYETGFTRSAFGVLHESGHALYDQNLPEKSRFQPISRYCSMGIHESVSRFVENIVGRSRAFWTYFLPELKKMTGKTFSDVDLDLVVRAVNDVKPSKIRIQADEVTYSLHIILRFEIEKSIMADEIKVGELPQVWNEKMGEFLGIKVEDDSEGVMQDTHWANGYVGYFPDYALGNVYDGMFLEAMEKKIPRWRDAVAKGDFSPVFSWLKENIWEKGNIMDSMDLVKSVTGKDIDSEPFLKYLNEKMKTLFLF